LKIIEILRLIIEKPLDNKNKGGYTSFMLWEIRNKKPRNYHSFVSSEDILTSTIFGSLRYFNNQSILINFLNKSSDLNSNLKIENDQNFKINFWENRFTEKNYCQPDLILSSNDYEIIIECKYRSSLSEEYEIIDDKVTYYSNQLIRYSKIIENSAKKKIIIYLTDELKIPTEIMEKTKKKINDKINLYWLSWSKLYLSLNENKDSIILENEKKLFNDLMEFLKKRGLVSFNGFTNYDYSKMNISFTWKYKTCFHYIYEEAGLSWRYKTL
jgi:hypothetical protein